MENKDVEKNDVQEEKEERKDGGMFFGILGVATLLITIVGATYAYFTATASNNNVIQGNAAVTGIDLVVEKISNEPDAGLIPMLDSDIQKGVKGGRTALCGQCRGGGQRHPDFIAHPAALDHNPVGPFFQNFAVQ